MSVTDHRLALLLLPVAGAAPAPPPLQQQAQPTQPTKSCWLLAAGAMEQAAFDKTQIDLAAAAARRRHPLRHPAPRVSP